VELKVEVTEKERREKKRKGGEITNPNESCLIFQISLTIIENQFLRCDHVGLEGHCDIKKQ
jgi:hypothetical protein